MLANRMRMGGLPAYIANAVDFDGTNDYLKRGAGFTGAADSSTGIISAWVRLDADTVSDAVILRSQGGKIRLNRRAGSVDPFLQLYLESTTGGLSLSAATSNYFSPSGWINILASWDTNFSAGNKLLHIYINNVSDIATKFDTDAAFNVDYTETDWGVGANPNGNNLLWNGCMSEVYFAPGQYLDFSNSANRAKFISGGKPVDLGSDGSLPTGTAPILYLKNPAASFGTNSGTGGNMTITGTLDVASTSPSD